MLGAASWTTAGHVLSQILRFGSNLALTRLVAPDAFGLMFVATSIGVTVSLICDAGFREVVVRSERGQDRAFLDTVWSLQVMRGVLLMTVALLIAGGLWLAERQGYRVGGVYDDPRFPVILAVLSISFMIQGLQSTRLWLAYRRMDTRAIVRIELTVQLVSLATIFGWAAFDASVWAMVAGSISSSVVGVILSHWALPGTSDRFRIEPDATREVLRFGRWIWLSSIITVLSTQFDKLFFGAIAAPTWIGQLSLAIGLVSALEAVIARVASTIALPYFADYMRVDRVAATRRFAQALIAVDCFAFLVAGGLYVTGPLIVDLLYPDSYADAGRKLSVVGAVLLMTRTYVSGNFLLALDRGAMTVLASIAKTVALVGCVTGGYALQGAEGALLGVAAHAVVFYAVTVCIDISSGARLRLLNLLPFAALVAGAAVGQAVVLVASLL